MWLRVLESWIRRQKRCIYDKDFSRGREGEFVSKHIYSTSFVVSIQTKTGFGLLKISNIENEKYKIKLI